MIKSSDAVDSRSAAVLSVVRETIPDFRDSQFTLSFEALNLDSFDLVTLRVAVEQALGEDIPDDVWLRFKTVDHILTHCSAASLKHAEPDGSPGLPIVRSLKLNMPQMSASGLSEYWMFKEFGDIHWKAICECLKTESHAITDQSGNRLYATFVRFRWEGTEDLSKYLENEQLQVGSKLSRYGHSMFLSDTVLEGQGKSIKATLLSSFVSRMGDNKGLMRGEPIVPADSAVHVLNSVPPLSDEYRQIRKGLVRNLVLAGEAISLDGGPIAEIAYEINPYHDVNGVNLLYFAAYPAISDFCERVFAHQNRDRLGIVTDWALETATIARDVLYFGNCDIDEGLIYRLHGWQESPGRRVCIVASISRRSDGKLLCNVITVKKRRS